MPRIADATIEGVEEGAEILRKELGNEIAAFKLIKSLIQVLNADGHSRVQLGPLLRTTRAKAICSMYYDKGADIADEETRQGTIREIARRLDIPVREVYRVLEEKDR